MRGIFGGDMTAEQLERLRSWAAETQRRLHSRNGCQRHSRDLNDLDAALETIAALAKEVDRLKLCPVCGREN